MLPRLVSSLCLVLALAFVAGCGDDDSEPRTTRTTAEARTLTDIEPRTSRPNVTGGSGPIAEFAQRAADDALNYYEAVFAASTTPYSAPTVVVQSETSEFCGVEFDPAKRLVFICSGGPSSEIRVGAQTMERIRSQAGDGAVAFLLGFYVGLEANAQLGPNPWAPGAPQVGPEFDQQAACFSGAWIRNLADRQLLEAGDAEEVRRQAVAIVPGNTDELKYDFVRKGYDNGISACRTIPSDATTGALLPEDVEPQAAAPNISGGNAPIAEFAQKLGAGVTDYFKLVFEQNKKPYRQPTFTILAQPGQDGCGAPFDPAQKPYHLCLSSSGSDKITLGAPYLERARTQSGDAAVAFLVGYGAALSAYDQLTGDRLAKGGSVDDEFIESSVCLVGAWGRYLASERLLQAGDDAELLAIAAEFIPGQTEEGVSRGQDFLALGFSQGSRGCTTKEAG